MGNRFSYNEDFHHILLAISTLKSNVYLFTEVLVIVYVFCLVGLDYSVRAFRFLSSAAMTFLSTWLVPSYIWVILASRIIFSTG